MAVCGHGTNRKRETAMPLMSISRSSRTQRHMNKIEDEVNRAVDDLVAQIIDVAYRAARESLESAGRATDRGSSGNRISDNRIHGRSTRDEASPLSGHTADHPARPAHSPTGMPPPAAPAFDASKRESNGADDLFNLANLSRLYEGSELDPGLGRFLADVLTLSRRLRE